VRYARPHVEVPARAIGAGCGGVPVGGGETATGDGVGAVAARGQRGGAALLRGGAIGAARWIAGLADSSVEIIGRRRTMTTPSPAVTGAAAARNSDTRTDLDLIGRLQVIGGDDACLETCDTRRQTADPTGPRCTVTAALARPISGAGPAIRRDGPAPRTAMAGPGVRLADTPWRTARREYRRGFDRTPSKPPSGRPTSIWRPHPEAAPDLICSQCPPLLSPPQTPKKAGLDSV